MWLVNIKIRVKKHPKGWAVERKKMFMWVHIVSVYGMPDEPWFFDTAEMAIEETKKYIGWDLLKSVHK